MLQHSQRPLTTVETSTSGLGLVLVLGVLIVRTKNLPLAVQAPYVQSRVRIPHLLLLEVYAAWLAVVPAPSPVASTLSGSTDPGPRGWRVQNPGGCQMLLVLPWFMDSCRMGPPMIKPTWSMNSSKHPRAALVACAVITAYA
jgi:hypothetical protein